VIFDGDQESRIFPKFGMVIDIFVTASDTVEALSEKVLQISLQRLQDLRRIYLIQTGSLLQ